MNRRAFLAGDRRGRRRDAPARRELRPRHGANEKLRVAFLGVGGRCQQHIDVILEMQKEGKAVQPVAVCDVWDGDRPARQAQQGPRPLPVGRSAAASSRRQGPRHQGLSQDPRPARTWTWSASPRPDHWHARMAIDAMDAGKDVYMRKADDPDDRRGDRGRRYAPQKTNKVMTVGVQSMADPTWQAANEYIAAGKIGHVMQGQTSYYRNYARSASGGTTRSPRT